MSSSLNYVSNYNFPYPTSVNHEKVFYNQEYLNAPGSAYSDDILLSVSPIASSLFDSEFAHPKDDIHSMIYKNWLLNYDKNFFIDHDFNIDEEQTSEGADHYLGSSSSSGDENFPTIMSSKFNYSKRSECLDHLNSHQPSPCINYLKNAIIRPQKFERLNPPQNQLLKKYEAYQKNKITTLVSFDEIRFFPLWTKSYAKTFWTLIFEQAELFEVYWTFFMDTSLNIILKTCEATIKEQANTNSTVLDCEKTTFFTKNDLEVLTRMSYNYYGRLIRTLRYAINNSQIEYPIKISMYATCTSFIHSHATVDTLSLLYNGSSSLLTKIVNEAEVVSDVAPSLQLCIQGLYFSSMLSVVPDYNFGIIHSLSKDLIDFKEFMILNKCLTNLRNQFPFHKLFQLESFMADLIHEVHPRFQYIDKFYKASQKLDSGSGNIEYVSPSMLFNLLVDWFNTFANESVSIGSKMPATTRTFYLFFTLIGKVLFQVFTPLRSVLLVEPLSILPPQVDFDPAAFKVEQDNLNQSQYDYLFKLSTKLIRLIKFFEFRSQIVAYYCFVKKFSDEKQYSYMECYQPEHDTNFVPSSDIIRIISSKVEMKEEMIINFNHDDIINISNFPMMEELASSFQDDETKTKYRKEILEAKERQAHYLKEKMIKKDEKNCEVLFDYESGLFFYDFNPQEAIKTYIESQNIKFGNIQNKSLEELKLKISNIDMSRKQIRDAIKHNSEFNYT